MNKPAALGRWFPGWFAAPRVAEDDAADYGTAFGLDLSLPETPPEPGAAQELDRPRLAWVRRLGDRRKADS